MTYAMYGGKLYKHFDGSLVTVRGLINK